MVILALGLSPGRAAAAEEQGWYAGGGVALTDYKEPDAIADLSRRGLAGTSRLNTQAVPWELFFGYRGRHHVGFEAGYLHLDRQEGKLDLTAPVQDSVDALQETDGFSALASVAHPLTRILSLQANIGMYLWHIQSQASSLASQTAVSAVVDHRGIGPRIGLCLEAIVSERSTLRFGWNMFRIYHETTSVYAFSFIHYFGKGP